MILYNVIEEACLHYSPAWQNSHGSPVEVTNRNRIQSTLDVLTVRKQWYIF
jgi:hypothetical protein